MTEFRPCPSHPGYEVNVHGVVRRSEVTKTYKTGLTGTVAAKVMKRVGRKLEYVTLKGDWIKVVALVEDAWSVTITDDGRPRSSYPDGKILHVTEWAEIMRRS